VNDPLSRLRAGLDRDEQLARAAASRAAEWKEMDDAVVGGPFYPAEPEHLITESGTHTIVYPEGWPSTAEAQHIAEFDPARTLRQVEAIRKVIARYEFVTSHGPAVDHTRAMDMTVGATAALRDVIEMLASIYTTAETEGAQP
jgi:hypothetical protein